MCKKPIKGAVSVGRKYCDECKVKKKRLSRKEYGNKKRVIPVELRLNNNKKYCCEDCGSPCYYKRCETCSGVDKGKSLSRVYNRRSVMQD